MVWQWVGGYSSIVSMYVCSVGGSGGGGGGGRIAAHIHSFHRSQVGAGEPSGAGAGKSKSRAAVPCPCYYPHLSVSPLCYVCMYVGCGSVGGVRPPVQWSQVRFPQVCSGSCAVRLPARVPAATAQRNMSRRRQVHAHALSHFQVTNLECIWEKEST